VSENELARTLGLHSQTATSTVVTRPQQQFSVRILDEGFLVTIPPNHRSATVFDTAQQEDGFPQSYTLALVKDFPWFSKSPHSQHRLVLVVRAVLATHRFDSTCLILLCALCGLCMGRHSTSKILLTFSVTMNMQLTAPH